MEIAAVIIGIVVGSAMIYILVRAGQALIQALNALTVWWADEDSE